MFCLPYPIPLTRSLARPTNDQQPGQRRRSHQLPYRRHEDGGSARLRDFHAKYIPFWSSPSVAIRKFIHLAPQYRILHVHRQVSLLDDSLYKVPWDLSSVTLRPMRSSRLTILAKPILTTSLMLVQQTRFVGRSVQCTVSHQRVHGS